MFEWSNDLGGVWLSEPPLIMSTLKLHYYKKNIWFSVPTTSYHKGVREGMSTRACTQAWGLVPEVFECPPPESAKSLNILTASMGSVLPPPMTVPTTQAAFIF